MKKYKKKRQVHKEEENEEEKKEIPCCKRSPVVSYIIITIIIIIIIIIILIIIIIIIIISSSSSITTLNIPRPSTNNVPELVAWTMAISDTRRNLASNQHLFATLRYKLHFQRANPKPTRPDAKTCWKTILIDAYVVRYGVLKRMDIVQGTN